MFTRYTYYLTSHFEKCLKKLAPPARERICETVSKVTAFLETGKKTPGLGVKKLKRSYWEARTDITSRVVYKLAGNEVIFLLSGSHDDIKRFLKAFKG